MRITIAAEDPDIEPALALDVAPDSEIDEEETEAGMFDQLDPLPDFDTSDEVKIQTDHASYSATFTDEDGAISVPNLTIANNFDKSKNDIDALEAALEAAKQGKINAPPPIKHELATELNGRANVREEETVLEAKVIDIPQTTIDDELNKQQLPPIDLDKLAQEIGTPDSLEDFSASMAETLFGSEAFDQIAAHVTANPPASDVNPVALVEDASPVQLMESDIPAAANDKDENVLILESKIPVISAATSKKDESLVALEAEVPVKPAPSLPRFTSNPPIVKMTSEIDLSASIAMRIDILNKAIDIKNIAKLALEEKSQKKSGGLFSRFRKSS
ncbi:MAG: hypothetical protein HOI35_09630 [Woeseia sp.]|jgi:hypothetical protein|nr:hypothetical protein [Woeseia sp.]MBT6210266.1 hypothetical protein [Woeseia sp.]